ncbi:MAG: hypothetical protein Q9211_007124, partial [Gyalolechia sp. 1 TL-2023]
MGLAFSPDGKRLAAGFGAFSSLGGFNSQRGGVAVWDTEALTKGGKPRYLPSDKGGVAGVAFGPDGSTLAAAFRGPNYAGGGVLLWVTNGPHPFGDPRTFSEGQGAITGVSFSPDGKRLAAVSSSRGTVTLLDVAQGLPVGGKLTTVGLTTDAAFNADGTTLAAGFRFGGDGGVALWDLSEGLRIGDVPDVLVGPTVGGLEAAGIAFLPDGKTLAVTFGGDVALVPTDPPSWIRQAGSIANRNFSPSEWVRFFPREPYRRTFENLPGGSHEAGSAKSL